MIRDRHESDAATGAGAQAEQPGFWSSPLTHAVILALVALFAYANTLHVPFLFDDTSSITENPVIRNPSNFFSNRSGYEDHPNRYIGYLTFALNYYVGGENVIGYHLANLAIHIANALLVYCLATLTLRTPFFKGLELKTQNSKLETHNFMPFLAALLFVCHPIQTQAVTYIVQRLTSLATLFYLTSLVLHVRWRLARQQGYPFRSTEVLPWCILSLVTAVLAMKTKEIAFTLPLVILLLEFCFFGRPDRKILLSLIPMMLTLLIIPISMINLQKSAGELLADVSTATVAQWPFSRGDYLCTQFSVIVTYLRLLLLPINQNLDYDYPVTQSLFEPRTLLSLLLLLALLAAAALLWRASSSSESRVTSPQSRLLRLAAFGIFWFFITLAVESSIIPIADVIFEHRVYLPSVGFFIALAALAHAVTGKLYTITPLAGKAAASLLVVVVVLLTGATSARNNVWKEWITLWTDTTRKSPNNPRAFNCLGVGYQRQNRHAEALRNFETAVRIFPEYAEGYYNRGVSLQALGRDDESLAMYERAVSLGLGTPQAYSNLGVLYAAQGRFDQAVSAFTEAVRRDPEAVVVRRNLAAALMQQGRLDDAGREFRNVLRLNPNDPKALRGLDGIVRLKAGGR